MPRPKSFDEAEALREIGQLFWRYGYAATGMEQICAHLSLTKPSVYNAFGDKANLFRRVVDAYAQDMLERGATILKGEAPVSIEMATMLRHFLLVPDKDIVSRGCLLTTSMLELQYSEPTLFDYVREQINRVQKAFSLYFSNARDNGRLRDDADPAALSEYVVTVLQGLRMQSRTSAGQTDLERIINTAMGPLKNAEPVVKSPKPPKQ